MSYLFIYLKIAKELVFVWENRSRLTVFHLRSCVISVKCWFCRILENKCNYVSVLRVGSSFIINFLLCLVSFIDATQDNMVVGEDVVQSERNVILMNN